MESQIDILIPTYNRPSALAVTLTSLIAQTYSDYRIIISDQSDKACLLSPEVRAVVNVMKIHGHEVQVERHFPRYGMAEQRQYLLQLAESPLILYLDDDLILEKSVLENMVHVIQDQNCGFVGCAVIGLSYLGDHRPAEEAIELWENGVKPERVDPGSHAWERYRLHNAANLFHVQQQMGLDNNSDPIPYKVAWVGGCVLYHAARLRSVGGFNFWKDLPTEHVGEDVLAQLRVMEVYGGCGLIPSGVYHQELPTTIPKRDVDAPKVLAVRRQSPLAD
jgi:glycosyltransferase involved in cell wall biosynthesis